MERYSRHFFEAQQDGSRRSADVIVPLLVELVAPSSVLDVGCGVGTWLSVFIDAGVNDVQGLDGDYVDPTMLAIDRSRFSATDISRPLRLGRGFDLAICLEVAEHLPPASSSTLVDSLIAHAHVVAFSAAIPGQGGTGHVNEQWPEYWIDAFDRAGFACLDVLRPMIWNNDRVEYWYAQNMLLFVDRNELEREKWRRCDSLESMRSVAVVHPRLQIARMRGLDTSAMPLRPLGRALGLVLVDLARLLAAAPRSAIGTIRRRTER